MKLLDKLVATIIARGLAEETAEAYRYQNERFILWHYQRAGDWVHPKDIGKDGIEAYLSYLANTCHVAASTQNAAFYAIRYLYVNVLGLEFENINALRAKRPKNVPTVLSQEEVYDLLAQMNGMTGLMAQLGYGCGFRITELHELRIKDVNLERRQITVWHGKGGKSRILPLPKCLVEPLREQFQYVLDIYTQDQRRGDVQVALPKGFARKSPNAAGQYRWAFLFPSKSLCQWNGGTYRHHQHKDTYRRSLAVGTKKARITSRVKAHTLRHCFATHYLEHGGNIKALQELMGHRSIKTTEIYLHVDSRRTSQATSPLDRLAAAPHPTEASPTEQPLRIFRAA